MFLFRNSYFCVCNVCMLCLTQGLNWSCLSIILFKKMFKYMKWTYRNAKSFFVFNKINLNFVVKSKKINLLDMNIIKFW